MKNQNTIKQSERRFSVSRVILSIILVGGIFILIFLGALVAVVICQEFVDSSEANAERTSKTLEADRDFTEEERDRLYVLINNYRTENGIKPLRVDPLLEKSASLKTQDFVASGYWGHHREGEDDSATWKTFAMVGYEMGMKAENLAENFYTPETLLKGWQDSEKHNENLLRDTVTQMGIASHCDETVCYITYHAYGNEGRN